MRPGVSPGFLQPKRMSPAPLLPGFTLAGDALREKGVALLLPDVRPYPCGLRPDH